MEDLSVPKLVGDGLLQSGTVHVLSGGGGHSALVTNKGELLVCGQNHKGQLGISHTTDVTSLQRCPLLNQRVAQVCCGWDFTILLTDGGQVLTCGSNAYGQLGVSQPITHSAEFLAVERLNELVINVAAGLRHSLAVTDTGSVYQWGKGLSGQARKALSPLPVPAHFSSGEPCLVPGLDHVKPHKVASGSAHCVCLTVEGDIFLWGSNKHGQLTTEESFLPHPERLNHTLFYRERVTDVWSGWTHLVAKTESGKVFTWGRGNYGQLGRTAPANQSTEESGASSTADVDLWACVPAEVKSLYGATQIACGSEHNLAIVGNRLLSWGWNEHGMCGDGSQIHVIQPQHIPGLRPLLIGCGAGHSMALCSVQTSKEPTSVTDENPH